MSIFVHRTLLLHKAVTPRVNYNVRIPLNVPCHTVRWQQNAVVHGAGSDNKQSRYGILSLFPPLFPFPPSSFPSFSFPSISFVSISCPGVLPQIQLGGLWNTVSFPSGSGPADKLFLVHSGLKIMLPVIVRLQKFPDNHINQVCIVIRIGAATYRYEISQKRTSNAAKICRPSKKEV